jgi:hypothetical protein
MLINCSTVKQKVNQPTICTPELLKQAPFSCSVPRHMEVQQSALPRLLRSSLFYVRNNVDYHQKVEQASSRRIHARPRIEVDIVQLRL